MNNKIRTKKMKKLLLSGLLGLLVFPVFAVGIVDATVPRTEPPIVTPETAIERILHTAFWLLFAVAGIFFIIGAFFFLTAGGDDAKLKKGKDTITWAIVALIVAVLARGLVEFIPRVFQ